MKKILSIAAVSIISSALLAVNADATSECVHSFESYAERINCSGSCKLTEKVQNPKTYEYDSILEELLKDCGVIYYDTCPIVPGIPQKPENDNEIQKPEQNKPIIPENKPEIEDKNPGNQSGGNQNSDSGQGGTKSEFANEVLELVNKERKANGLSPVTSSNASLNSAADKRAAEQAVSFSHTRPDGRSWSTVLSDYGVKYGAAGENVAYGQRTPEEVMQAWMNSSGHRANILNASYKELGIGVYYKNGTYYWSQLFIG